jgi:hypothetical protein
MEKLMKNLQDQNKAMLAKNQETVNNVTEGLKDVGSKAKKGKEKLRSMDDSSSEEKPKEVFDIILDKINNLQDKRKDFESSILKMKRLEQD